MINGQTQNKLIGIFFFICMMCFIIGVIRVITITPSMDSDRMCKLEHGDNWEHNSDDIFGKTCIEPDYNLLEVVSRVKLNLTYSEIIAKHCCSPGFWELSKWESYCDDSQNKPGVEE